MQHHRVIVCLLTTLIVIAWGSALAKQYTFEKQKIFAVGDEVELEINYFTGNIEVTTHDVDRVVVKIVKRVDAVGMDEARHIADNLLIKSDQSRSKITINAAYLKKIKQGSSLWEKLLGTGGDDPYGTVDFHVMVPERCAISIGNNTGDVNISNIVGAVSVESSSSTVNLNAIEGPVTVNNSAGETHGELLFGPVTINQPMGSIDLMWIEGDIRIKSSAAAIKIRQENGSIDLTTTTGNVDIQTNMYTGRDCFVSTGSGDINFRVPGSTSSTLEIMSELGNIETQMPIKIKSVARDRLVGELGDGGVKISLTSSTGDVTIAEF